jgi:UDP-glucose 4-epimerase
VLRVVLVNVLVTGGAGCIGGVVVARLLEAGHEVTVIDDLSTGHRDAVSKNARFVLGRVQQASSTLGLQAFDSVVHLTASSLVAESIANPQKYQTNNVAGSYGAIGERHDSKSHLISLTLRAALEGRSVDVFGDDYATPDGTCIRDYIHVVDIADAHLLALGASSPGRWRVYNLGNGAGSSVRQVIAAARRVTGMPLAERVTGRRMGDPAMLVASSERARRELDWVPRRPELDEMVDDAWRFVQRRQI